jgi:hypothetical protein
MARVVQTVFNLLPSMMLILAFTLFVGAVVRRKRLAVGLATVFVIGSFMLDIVGSITRGSIAEQLRALSFFRYYDSTGVCRTVWCGVRALLVVISIGLLGGALLAFQRRDICI